MREALYTPSEAAVVTGVPVKEVNRLVDKGMLRGAVVHQHSRRKLPRSTLVGLKAAYDTAEILTAQQRRSMIQAVLARPGVRRFRVRYVTVHIDDVAAQMRAGIARLERARKLVVEDPQILSGTPVFKGTRIPVHDVAAMIAAGETLHSIQRHYPRLSAEHYEIAPVYASAYPLRGRPRRLVLSRKYRLRSERVFRKAV